MSEEVRSGGSSVSPSKGGDDGGATSIAMANATHSTTPEGAFLRVLQVNVSRICNVQTTREEGAWVTFSIDFDGTTSPASDSLQPADEIPLGYEYAFDVVTETPSDVERMVNSTINITVKEHFKEKKKKNETVTRLGHVSIDALPLLLGESAVEGTYELVQEPNVHLARPMTLDVCVTAPHPLMNEHQVSTLNILTCTVKTVSKLPSQLQHGSGASVFSLHIGERDHPLHMEFTDGSLTTLADEEASVVDVHDVDNTDVNAPLETDASRVVFPSNRHRRCLSVEDHQRVVDFISKHRRCPVTLNRTTAATGKSKSKVDDDVPTQRAVAGVQFTHLLYPGVTAATFGALLAAIHPEPQEGDTLQTQDDGKKSKSKKGTTPLVPEVPSAEGQMFEDAGTFAVLEFSLVRPLIQQRTEEEIARRVAALVPPREIEPAPLVTAQQALDGYKERIATIASDLVAEYRSTQQTNNLQSNADVKQRVLYKLNTTGKYEAFKEQLKQAVMSLVREKFPDTSDLRSSQTRQTFMSKLYVYLTREMHAAINREFSFDRSSDTGVVRVEKQRLFQFAHESEGLLQLDKAQLLWDECVQRFASDPECWYQYAAFAARVGDTSKAEECLRRAISIDQKHTRSLALLGLLAVLDGRSHEGLDLLEAATAIAPASELLWTLRYLAVQYTDPDDVTAELHLDTALKNQTPREGHYTSCLLFAADALIDMGMPVFAQSAVAAQLAMEGPSIGARLIEARLGSADDDTGREKAKQLLDECLSERFDDAEVWARLGHAHFPHDPDKARQYYEHALALPGVTREEDLVRLRLGHIYLADDDYALAKDMYLRACNQRPSSAAWLGLGTACFRLGELADAEDALAEANIYDPKNPAVWAYLCLICLRTGRGVEAEQCYKYAAKQGLDPAFKQEIELEMKELGVEPVLVQ